MDRNTIIGILLIALIFIGYSYFNNTRLTKSYEREIAVADSLYEAENYPEAINAYRKAASYKPRETYPASRVDEINRIMGIGTMEEDTTETAEAAERPEQMQPSAPVIDSSAIYQESLLHENEFITLENDVMRLTVATLGGRPYSAELKEYTTYDTLPLILFDGDSTIFGLQFFTQDNHPIETNRVFFEPQTDAKYLVAEDEPVSLTMRYELGNGRSIDYVYTMQPEGYLLDLDLQLNGINQMIGRNISSIDLTWEMFLPQQEKGRQNEDYYAAIRYKHYQDEVDGFRMRSNKDMEEKEIPTKVRWVAFKDQFFSSVIIAEESFMNAWVRSEKTPDSEKYLRFYSTKVGIPLEGNDSETFNMHMYLGPNHFKILKTYDLELEDLVFLGRNIIRWINQYVIINIFNWLNKYFTNYGIIILLMTIIIKMALFPLTYRSYISQAKMRVLKPEVDKITAKFPKREDAMKKQQATMDLYKRAGVSPLGGCLPMVLQMPILFAMFRFFPTSIELRQESFLWADDLSTYDSILDLPFNIPMYGDHVSLFTLLMTVSTIITMRINSPAQTGSSQMPGMQGMMYIMPVMFMVFLNNFSAGLTYYYFLANIITFIQNLITKRFVDEEEILKKLEDNKKKPPKKKSGWQKRLEEAAKQRGYAPPKKKR
jgi:YidC/Oxa1 family membrane protein insertase